MSLGGKVLRRDFRRRKGLYGAEGLILWGFECHGPRTTGQIEAKAPIEVYSVFFCFYFFLYV